MSAARLLGPDDLSEVRELLRQSPAADVFVASRVEATGLEPWRSEAQLWGFGERDRLEAVCWSGANLVPVQAGPDAVRAFAARARRTGRRCSSIVGAADGVRPLWRLLEPHWDQPRDVRPDQPLLAIDTEPQVAPDPNVRPVRPDELDLLLPACVAMFSEEIGVSPMARDGGSGYRSRVAEMIDRGHAFARIENGMVMFKAEVGAASAAAGQIQGVWVHPSLRGRGLSIAGTAAVVALVRARVAPIVSLYVNDFNLPARRAYARVGFTQVGTYASVLF